MLYLTLHCHYRIIGFVVTSSQPQRLYQGDVGHTASGVAFQVDSSRLPGYATEGTLWASLSGVILQTLPELVTLLKAHSEHRFPVSSSRLPELVTLLKAHSEHCFPVSSSRLPELVTLLKAHSEHCFPVSSSRLPELVTLLKAHSEHCFPASSSRLCLKSKIGYATEGTLFNSCCCLPTGSALRKFGYL